MAFCDIFPIEYYILCGHYCSRSATATPQLNPTSIYPANCQLPVPMHYTTLLNCLGNKNIILSFLTQTTFLTRQWCFRFAMNSVWSWRPRRGKLFWRIRMRLVWRSGAVVWGAPCDVRTNYCRDSPRKPGKFMELKETVIIVPIKLMSASTCQKYCLETGKLHSH